ncbi:hypothetical protein EDM68_05060 [Candidatus Uhrbacteria bacterium]|nr:MAG: hypothetical protein EDM68_05060 [Candidatus Uhrbacteria bacterium]
MPSARAIATTLPFALPTPVGRKIEVAAKRSWAIVFVIGAVACMAYQVFLMNSTATKGYTLRHLEKQLDQLHATVMTLENRTAELQALHTIESRIQGMGYVTVDRMEFVDVTRGSYALAR